MFLGIIFPDYIVFLGIMIKRTLSQTIQEKFFKGKAIVLLGSRQVGKTTLIKQLLLDRPYLFLNGDDPATRDLLERASLSRLKNILGEHNLVFIDEAQRIPDIGLTAKMIIDTFHGVQLLLSGSSALEINHSTQESLTGRKFEYLLYPISWEEFEAYVGFVEAESQLEERLVFGMYPDVVNHRSEAREVLQQLTASYLYKDVLSLTGIRKPELLDKLLKALALQLGSEVSYNELARLLEIDKATISRYIDLLEKSFIVFRLNSFSRNQRNEIKQNRKIYFYDNGIRNMVINHLAPLSLRNDKGPLWENFLISERIKAQAYHRIYTQNYFWRTVQKQEIDFIEETDGRLSAYEFKWKITSRTKLPASFLQHYGAEGKIIDRDSFRDFVCGK
jgi:predicted AAA+ superfamily ATPase